MESRDKDRLDEWLDDALQRYGEVEPRVGLERRILANLAARGTNAGRWRWGWASWAATTAAVACLVAVGMIGWHTRQKIAAKQPETVPAMVASQHTAGEQPATESHAVPAPKGHQVQHRRYQLNAIMKAEPRLEQFPSPRPLSQQEQLLAGYVAQFHDKAILMARAQTKLREQEEMEMPQPSGGDDGFETSQ